MSPVLEQSMSALELANRIRMDRAAVRRDVKAMTCEKGRLEVAFLILTADELWDKAKLSYVLRMPRQSGWHSARLLCDRAGVSANKTVGSLTERQRVVLAGLIAGRWARS